MTHLKTTEIISTIIELSVQIMERFHSTAPRNWSHHILFLGSLECMKLKGAMSRSDVIMRKAETHRLFRLRELVRTDLSLLLPGNYKKYSESRIVYKFFKSTDFCSAVRPSIN